MSVKMFHNPRCSKSRATLQLLAERGIEPEIILYLQDPPGTDEITRILRLLNFTPRELMRRGESEYRELGLDQSSLDDRELIEAMAKHPKLIERPIVLANGKAAVGRPPESILSIL